MIFKKDDKIVFAGDSVTDDGRARPIGDGEQYEVGNGFVQMIAMYLAVDYPELNLRCINMGIGGNTSRDLLCRWDNDINALRPDWVVMMIGANDVWRQFDSPCRPERAVLPDEYRKNLGAIADRTKAKTIWLTPYYLEPNENDAMRATMDEYRAIMKEVAAERGIPVVDTQEAFAHILKYRYPAYITWDRVHPNKIGSMILARAFLKAAGYKARYKFGNASDR